jgi:ketosteroid isomerase-like protein
MTVLRIVPFVLIVAGCQTAPQHSDPAPLDQATARTIVERLNARWLEAFEAHDAAALARLFVPTGVRLPHGAPPAAGTAQLQEQYAHDVAQMPANMRTLLIVDEAILNGNWILARGRSRAVVGAGSTAFEPNDPKWFAVLERDTNGDWKYRWSGHNESTP